MKKLMSASLAIALLVTAVPAVLAKEGDNGNAKGKGKVEVEVSVDSKKNEEKEMKKEKTSEKEETTKNSSSAKPVLENVKLKKELIELRQELKHTTEISDKQRSKYETLVSELEKQADISQAVEVQLELVERYYNKADRSSVDKLGKLLKKNGNTEITTLVDGKVITSDVKPFMQGGRALVPIRVISAALKADVKWDDKTRSVLITRGSQSITLYLDKKEATVNGKDITLETAPVLKNGRLFLPLRFVSEQLKTSVDWKEEGKIVLIDDLQD
ncbi:copper amine oxidase N-terminal domain-containing protein [Brevibacillus laterosporus]|uniref:Copper amine oxidase n=1 Tax=Brevibacillus laterosporus TaxID=1465 RepID=A0AAP3GA14_BRELA|nr:copper amine oxidase N-terminal domain-containing protein [Brevibacillus laterosporus]MCR8979427.1 stalk domain-containing protein [Brevibacillus laterosporus]MCZ0806582.1 copper amine oxidase N-terminal domain-containing protein [Brevibacillus laterosporus]MCZ0825030.1 copper amine oxidase N-terminal domain-containing protein [Brevibacillus laterosporus]MCZ0849893.1 copper amine oxidase N-terminal domain-containing protein [Brevibacillus laterosporus]PPA93682.1 copper amine oxidase [Brevib